MKTLLSHSPRSNPKDPAASATGEATAPAAPPAGAAAGAAATALPSVTPPATAGEDAVFNHEEGSEQKEENQCKHHEGRKLEDMNVTPELEQAVHMGRQEIIHNDPSWHQDG